MTQTIQMCNSCKNQRLDRFYSVDAVPVQSCVLVDSLEVAKSFPLGRIDLDLCLDCGFIQNSAFDPSLVHYNSSYEETQSFSPRFCRFLGALADDLVARHGLVGRGVLEIGCGKGEFLQALADRRVTPAIGFDPGFAPSRASSDIVVHRELYDESHGTFGAALVAIRHTLEHIAPVGDFLRGLAGNRDEASPMVFVEVPDMGRVLETNAYWDIYYEHCSYFTADSLSRAMHRAGIFVQRTWLDYDDQYLMMEGQAGAEASAASIAGSNEAVPLPNKVRNFAESAAEEQRRWNEVLVRRARAERRVVIWGAGSKAVAFVSTLDSHEAVDFLVDVNPHKHGKHLPGSGLEVRAPQALRQCPPDLVIVMNSIYRAEITTALHEMQVDCEVVCLD